MSGEVWRAVPDFEGLYEVSSLGRVRSLPRMVKHSHGDHMKPLKGRVLAACLHTGGYLQVTLCKLGVSHKRKIHRLVLVAHVGPCPDGFVCCHNDGDHKNNNLENLRWDTVTNNMADKKEHGTHLCGEAIPHSKLTADDVRRIRARCAAGENQRKVADDYPVTSQTINDIHRGRRWSWLA